MKPEHQLWVFICCIGSLVSLFAINLVPMKRIAQLMGTHLGNRQLSVIVSEAQLKKACQIGNVMFAVSKHVPWHCKCLSEALCVKWLLNRYDIPSVMYLGARIDADDVKGMQAHAWVNVGRLTVIGGSGHKAYTVVACFTTPAFC
jgi:transglutaminase superfamily protein